MTDPARIRWTAGAEASMTAHFGLVANCGPHLFQIFKPVFKGDQYTLRSELPGQRYSQRDGDPDTLKAEAERWLEGFVSSLGAVFPAEPFEFEEGDEPIEVRWAAGRRVRYAHADAGYPGKQEHIAASLSLGEVYTIGWADIGQSRTDLNLYRDGAPLGQFNSVFFEPADDETTAATTAREKES